MQPNSSVFLIDDDRTSNMINTEIIRIFNKSVRVSSFVNAIKALEELEQLSHGEMEEVPTVIFLDINMPMTDGWEFLDEYVKLNNKIQDKCQVYILTSSIDPEDIEKAKHYKMVQGFISKPLTITHLKIMTDGKKQGTQYLSHLKFFYPTNQEFGK